MGLPQSWEGWGFKYWIQRQTQGQTFPVISCPSQAGEQ